MSYTFRKIDNTYVVWFAPANRYMQLQKPAFRILEDWSNHLDEFQIIQNCSLEYKLPIVEAQRFVSEVISQFNELTKSQNQDEIMSVCEEICFPTENIFFSIKTYLINGKTIRFRYNKSELEDLIHPGFCYLENKLSEPKTDFCFDLFQTGDQLFLQVNEQTCWKFPESKQQFFIGQVYTQIINCLYQVTDAHWMGAVHASAVSAGNGAVLFTAPSGSGKSTFAAMLMKEGYQVLSDDFSPLSLNSVQVYPFPEGISVKNRSLQVLQPHYPSLAEAGELLPDHVLEIFIPVVKGELPEPTKVTAIVFLQYDPEIEVDFKKIPNLEMMDRFLRELWLPPSSEVAEQFMDWYFQTPCYSLKYSDTEKAISTVSRLFHP